MKFEEPFTKGLPPELVFLDVSNSAFCGDALRSLFDLLTMAHPHQTPIIFRAANIEFHRKDLGFLEQLDPFAENRNVAEFDWSGTEIPKRYSQSFFDFLASQKALKWLAVKFPQGTSHLATYLSQIVRLVISSRLVGIDLSFSDSNELFVQVAASLTEAKWLDRLCLKFDGGGDRCLSAYGRLLLALPAVTEVAGDGFAPSDADVFNEFWQTVDSHPSIRACDFPERDSQPFDPRSELMTRISRRPRPSAVEQRRDAVIEGVDIPSQIRVDVHSAYDSVVQKLEEIVGKNAAGLGMTIGRMTLTSAAGELNLPQVEARGPALDRTLLTISLAGEPHQEIPRHTRFRAMVDVGRMDPMQMPDVVTMELWRVQFLVPHVGDIGK
jgi:hypothetical protein